MGNVTQFSPQLFIYIFITILFVGLFIYIFAPQWYRLLIFIIMLYIKILHRIDDAMLANGSGSLMMLQMKLRMKLVAHVERMLQWSSHVFLFIEQRLCDMFGAALIQETTRKGHEMAIRSIAAGRIYEYVMKSERSVDGKIMPLDEALNVAEENGWSVFKVRARTARAAAEERDRMTEIRPKGKQMVYEIRSGTMDMMLLLGSLCGWSRVLPPDGVCERCGVTHNGEFLDYDTLVNSKANQDAIKNGVFKNEIALDHLTEDCRQELAAFVRKMEDGLGEGSDQPTDG